MWSTASVVSSSELLVAVLCLARWPAVPGLRAADRPACLGRVVNASCWGWSATDSDLNSAALQAAILSGADRVIVPKMPAPWVVNVSMAKDSPYVPVHACTPAWDEECCVPNGHGEIPLPDGSNPPCCILPGQEFTNCSSQWRAAIYLPGNSSAGSANDTEIFFEPGVQIVAQRGSFYGQQDCLFLAMDASNITLLGYNASLTMWKADYQRASIAPASCTSALSSLCAASPLDGGDTCLVCAGRHANELTKASCDDAEIEMFCSGVRPVAPYKGSQFRFATNWYRSDRIRIYGLTISSSDSLGSCRSLLLNYAGGDGIDFGDGPPAMTNVHVKDVVLDNHLRQGMSICGGMINLTVEDTVMSNTGGHAPACGLDIELDHHDNIVRNLTFKNVRFINNSNCGISISPSALVANPSSPGKYDMANHFDARFEDILIDNRGQGFMSGDDMAGVQVSFIPAALSGTIDFNRLRVIGGNSPAFIAWGCSSAPQAVQTTVRNSIFERNSNGGLYWLPKRTGTFASGWTGKPWNGAYSNSPISVQPNWGEASSILNMSYGNLVFQNTSILLTPTTDRLDVVTLMPFSQTSGLANLRGNLHVYATDVCSCCKVNSFCAKGSDCATPQLPLNLTCHDARQWPYG